MLTLVIESRLTSLIMASTGDRPRLPEVKAALEAAANARGAAYHSTKAVIFHFENDNTAAKDDVGTLAWCLEDVFNIQPTVVKLEATDKLPGCTLTTTVNTILEKMKASSNPLPSLLILAYIGHGMLDTATGLLKLVAGPGKTSNGLISIILSSPPTTTRPMSIPSAS
jgi:hypothetical protein